MIQNNIFTKAINILIVIMIEYQNCCFKGEGFLTIDTLKGILLELEPDLTNETLQEIIDEVDEDGSGTIDFDGKFFIL